MTKKLNSKENNLGLRNRTEELLLEILNELKSIKEYESKIFEILWSK